MLEFKDDPPNPNYDPFLDLQSCLGIIRKSHPIPGIGPLLNDIASDANKHKGLRVRLFESHILEKGEILILNRGIAKYDGVAESDGKWVTSFILSNGTPHSLNTTNVEIEPLEK